VLVAVVGAGIGGLAAANGLQRAGADVEVWERAPAPRRSGSGLSVFGNGWTALDAVGVGTAAREVAGDQVVSLQAGQRVPDGRWLARTPAHAVRELRIVHRNELTDVLLRGLAPGTVRHDVSAGLGRDDGSLEVDGSTRRYDVVVGADGLRSGVRRSLGLDTGVRYAGYCAWRGVTLRPVDLRGAAGETWGRGLRFGCAPLRDGRVYWFAVATADIEDRSDDEHRSVTETFAAWHEPVPELLAATDPVTVSRLPVEDLRSPLRSFRRGRTVLLGDAAHAMTPDLGQGGNQALEDAAVLTTLLAPIAGDSAPDPAVVGAALRRYDRVRRRRTQSIAARARRLGRVAQAGGRLTAPARDASLRLVPDRLLARPVLAIQDWRP
jgi:2-polyprenyl-6-methoxyphenol hydroxylase-like FAD-dependent oxidoreductase